MVSRLGFVVLALLGLAAAAPSASNPAQDPDAIFARAKDAWRMRSEPPYVTFGLLERYAWRSHVHDNWWQVAYRSADHKLALQRVIVAEQEDARLKGAPIRLNIRMHRTDARGDSLDTNPNADAFPILDPLIEPDASFGLMRHEDKIALVGSATPTPLPGTTPAPTALPTATEATASPLPRETPLREIVRVEAVARDYQIALAGVDHLRYGDAYHLVLAPLHDPKLFRLRDLWVATTDYVTLQLAVAGLFDGAPYDGARWVVSYVPLGGRYYVQQIKTDDTLRFGLDRFVSGLEFNFVQYEFPGKVPDYTFERLL